MKRKKNILIIGSDLKVKGGMVSVIKNYLDYQDWESCNIHYIPCYIEKNLIIMLGFYFLSLIKIKRFIRRNDIDLVHLHMAERGSFFRKAFIVKMCKKRKLKVVIHHHGAEFELFYNNSCNMIKKYIRNILHSADLNIVLSKRLVQMVINISPNANVRFLYNAVKTYTHNRYNTSGNNILFLGRLGERKGVYDLLNVIKNIDSSLPQEIMFSLCGDGEVDKVTKVCEELGIKHRINHIGWIDDQLKGKFLHNTLINVLPSYNEGLPMTILETMSYGIPNISTNIASIPEVIISNENGYLINPGDVESLALYIKKLVFDESLRSEMSQESYNLVTNKFSIAEHIKQLEQYYQEVMEHVS